MLESCIRLLFFFFFLVMRHTTYVITLHYFNLIQSELSLSVLIQIIIILLFLKVLRFRLFEAVVQWQGE